MSTPLLIELHRSGWIEEGKSWTAKPFMVDVCHIEKIEADLPGYNHFLSVEKNEEIRRKAIEHIPEPALPGIIPPSRFYTHCSIVHYKGEEIKVLETYEKIREKIGKAGVVIP